MMLLRKVLPELHIESAGLGALVGESADSTISRIAEEMGIDMSIHHGQQISRLLTDNADLILVMEKAQLDGIHFDYPHLRGRVFLLSHFTPGKLNKVDVLDPYREDEQIYRDVCDDIKIHVDSLIKVIKKMM